MPFLLRLARVSTLVLMDSWIKTLAATYENRLQSCFNPCFNGFMDKDYLCIYLSILV